VTPGETVRRARQAPGISQRLLAIPSGTTQTASTPWESSGGTQAGGTRASGPLRGARACRALRWRGAQVNQRQRMVRLLVW